MKRKITFLMAALMLLCGLGWAQTSVTWPASTALPDTATAVNGDENITIKVSSTNPFTNPLRIYANTTVTINAQNDAKITSVTYTAYSTGNYVTNAQNATVSPEVTPTVNSTNVTWTYAESDNVTEFTFKPSTQTRSNGITITYVVGNSDIATPTFSPASGTEFYDEGLEVTISCETEDVDIYYTLDGTDPTDESEPYNGAISITETTTIKAIAYDGDDNVSNIAIATYTYVDLNAPGAINNPYTVAQARAAIDVGTGTTNVYATGIVSSIPTAWSTQYNNISFNFVDNDGDTDFLQAFRCVSSNNADASEVAVGDSVVVYGSLTLYNSTTYEFNAGCQLVSLTHPTHAVETPTFSPEAGTYAEAQTVTISCETEDVDIYYTLDGTDPTDESEPYSSAITVDGPTTIKAIAYDGNNNSAIATASYHICSADNAYTVAQALAFVEYPANGIYVQGIVSTAPSSLSSGTLTYYISDDGEATNQLQVYKGKGLENASFTSTDDIQVGDIVTIYGNVKIYNETYEFDNGNYLVAWERPVSTEPTINASNIEIAYDATTGEIAYTIDNPVDGVELTATTDAEWISDLTVGESSITFTTTENEGDDDRTATITLSYEGAENVEVTVTQSHYVADYATLPFEFDGGKTDIEETAGLTQYGLGSDYGSAPKLKFDNTGDYLVLHFNEQPGKLTFDIKGNGFSGGTFTVETSVDGETWTALATYTTLVNTQSEEFNNLNADVRYIRWIYTEKSSGNVALGNIVLEQYTEPDEYVLNIGDPENITITAGYDTDGVLTNGESIEVLSGTEITLTLVFAEGYVLDALTVVDEDQNEIAVTASTDAENVWSFYMPNTDVTVMATAAEYVAPSASDYVRITSLDQLTDGSKVIIAARYNTDNTSYYAMTNTSSGKPTGTAFSSLTSNNDETLPSAIADEEDTYYWTVNVTDDGYTFTNANDQKIGYNSGTSFTTGGDNTTWTIAQETSASTAMVGEYEGFVVKNGTTASRAIAFNGSVFGAYATTNMAASGYNFFLDFFVKAAQTETFTLEIAGYANNPNGGYYLIASPINSINPEEVENMLDNDYDLYFYEENPEDGYEWRNYKANAFKLESGVGYLYANSEDVVLTFTGTPYSGDGVVTLSKQGEGELAGWNLVGNPFAVEATIDRDYYTMNAKGSEIIVGEGSTINAMQGIFVVAEDDEETMTFTPVTSAISNDSKLVINVSRNRGDVIDRAIVRIGHGRNLPKFMLNQENTRMYIPQDNNDFAVVRSERSGNLPITFQPTEKGTYTIRVNVEATSMRYLHLIDRKTGKDINLLHKPSYTFVASTSEKPERFELVYSAGINISNVLPASRNVNNDDFSFFANGSWIIDNEGDAILQVIDVNGRIMSSEEIHGGYSKAIETAPGVYMLRLINGDNVKTQKIVVE